MKYASGYDFWYDLKLQFGEDAVKIANAYLDIPMRKDDAEELQFRKELYQASGQSVSF